MEDGMMMFTVNEDGKLVEYDDAYDITIHCESEEEQDEILEILNGRRWIPCSEKLPAEGTEVLGCNAYGQFLIGWVSEDDDFGSETGFIIAADEGTILTDAVAWMSLPEPYEREDEEC